MTPHSSPRSASSNATHRNRTCLSADFVSRKVNAQIRCEQLWRSLRAKNDWDGFLPAFEAIVALAREEAQLRAAALGLSPYDALVEQFDPGSRSAEIATVFADLKRFLTGFIPEALEAQARRRAARPAKPFHGDFPPERQKMLGVTLMTAVGFDFDHGRLDISHHPFCSGVPSDVRMTTRYTTHEFLSSLMGILHETGHGLYEQGLPAEWQHWPSGKARGMAMHESQSLFQEMQISRTPRVLELRPAAGARSSGHGATRRLRGRRPHRACAEDREGLSSASMPTR